MRVLNLVFGMAAVGGAVYEAFVIFPAARERGTTSAVETLRALRLSPHRVAYRYLPVSGLASGLAALAIVILWNEQPRSAAVLTLLGLLAFIGALILNLMYWGMAEKDVYRLTTPIEEATLARLAVRNVARATAYVVGFVAFAVAAVIG